jgi:hypothetical protein
MIAKQAIPVSYIHVGDTSEFEFSYEFVESEFSFEFVEFVFLGLFGGFVAVEQVQGVSV